MVGVDFYKNVLENFYLRKGSKKYEISPTFGSIIFENKLPASPAHISWAKVREIEKFQNGLFKIPRRTKFFYVHKKHQNTLILRSNCTQTDIASKWWGRSLYLRGPLVNMGLYQ